MYNIKLCAGLKIVTFSEALTKAMHLRFSNSGNLFIRKRLKVIKDVDND